MAALGERGEAYVFRLGTDQTLPLHWVYGNLDDCCTLGGFSGRIEDGFQAWTNLGLAVATAAGYEDGSGYYAYDVYPWFHMIRVSAVPQAGAGASYWASIKPSAVLSVTTIPAEDAIAEVARLAGVTFVRGKTLEHHPREALRLASACEHDPGVLDVLLALGTAGPPAFSETIPEWFFRVRAEWAAKYPDDD